MNRAWQVVWNEASVNHSKIVHVLKESFRKSSWKHVAYCEETRTWAQILNVHYLLSEKSGYLFVTHSPHSSISPSPHSSPPVHQSKLQPLFLPTVVRMFLFSFNPSEVGFWARLNISILNMCIWQCLHADVLYDVCHIARVHLETPITLYGINLKMIIHNNPYLWICKKFHDLSDHIDVVIFQSGP